MSTLRLTGEILAAAHRQLAHRLDRPHPGWRQDPVLAHRTIGELVSKSEDELLSYKNFGKKSLDEIKERFF